MVLHDPPSPLLLFLLLTQQPNVLRLQEFLGAKRTSDRAGMTCHRRHGRVQIPILDGKGREKKRGEDERWVKRKVQGSEREEGEIEVTQKGID